MLLCYMLCLDCICAWFSRIFYRFIGNYVNNISYALHALLLYRSIIFEAIEKRAAFLNKHTYAYLHVIHTEWVIFQFSPLINVVHNSLLSGTIWTNHRIVWKWLISNEQLLNAEEDLIIQSINIIIWLNHFLMLRFFLYFTHLAWIV